MSKWGYFQTTTFKKEKRITKIQKPKMGPKWEKELVIDVKERTEKQALCYASSGFAEIQRKTSRKW